jgi:hypothetical protein
MLLLLLVDALRQLSLIDKDSTGSVEMFLRALCKNSGT